MAENMMGVMAANGEGVVRNDKTAFGWYKSAAEKGDATAQFNLGVAYFEGRGTPMNYQEALKWVTRAADQNQPQAIAALRKLGIR